jgi:hypothetical protein
LYVRMNWNKALALAKSKEVAWVFVLLFGSGAFFQWRQTNNEANHYQLDLTEKTTGLRQQENEQYFKLLSLNDDYMAAVSEYSVTRKPETRAKMLKLQERAKMEKDDFLTLESKLARLEGREPRTFRFEFYIPSEATGLRAEVR